MSYDIKLATTCNHRVYRRVITLEPDYKTFVINCPITNYNIELYADDQKLPSAMYYLDRSKINNIPVSKIVLNKKWRSNDSVFEVSYITTSEFCTKCNDLKVIDDLNYNIKGQLILVKDENLLLQNIEKFVVTRIGSNIFHKYIGTNLTKLIGEKISDRNYLNTKIVQEINSSLDIFKDLQTQYVQTGRPVSDAELLNKIVNINITYNKDDPSIIEVSITCESKSKKYIELVQYLRRII